MSNRVCPNTYQASPSQGRRSSPSDRRAKPKRRTPRAIGESKLDRVPLQCRLRFQRWRYLDEVSVWLRPRYGPERPLLDASKADTGGVLLHRVQNHPGEP